MKFGMEHPLEQRLRSRKNQFEGPCEDHVLAVKGKGTMGYTQNCEIWHQASLGTFIKTQEEPFRRAMLRPCLGHKKAMIWKFLTKGAMGYTEQSKIWLETSPGKLINTKGVPRRRTM